MIFGITMSPMAWLYTFVTALLIILAPLLAIDSFAHSFDDPIRTIINIVGIYILVPILLSYWYMHKIKKTKKGSMIFIIYFGLYLLMFLMTFLKLLSGTFTLDTIAGSIIIGAVSFYMFSIFQKSKKILEDIQNKEYQAIREDDIQRQTEAILRAQKFSNNS